MSEIDPKLSDLLREAALDIRYLADRGYRKDSAVRFVSDHYRLPKEDRYVLSRVVVPRQTAESRRKKAVSLEKVRGRALFVDGYNVLITMEGLLKGLPVYLCDDGFLRDAQGIFKSYKPSWVTVIAQIKVLEILKEAEPSRVEFLFDQQISMSGSLASEIREKMSFRSIEGVARTARDVDRQLKEKKSIVATGDGNVIDAVGEVIDLPGEMARKEGIEILKL